MKLIWVLLSLVVIGAAIASAQRSRNPNARIGLYFLAAAGGLALLGALVA